MMLRTPIALTGAWLIVVSTAQAKPVPVPKHGHCPSGYHESGSYCTPMTPNAPPAIPKAGTCPRGWMQSGDYCIQMQRR
jgi:hypothetical protein